MSVCALCSQQIEGGTIDLPEGPAHAACPPRPCMWPLGHRDRHQCGCTCALVPGHTGRHQCALQVAAAVPPTDGDER